MNNITPRIISSFIALILFSLNTSYSQSLGDPADFSIRGDVYSGTFTTLSDDWFQGATGLGIIDESQTAAFTAITNNLDNTPFLARQNYPQYQTVNGKIFYDAIYGRDYGNIGSAVSKYDQTTFAGNSGKNGDDPAATWIVDTGGTPTEGIDLVDVYAHLRRDGTTVDTDLWINLGLSTMSNSGTHYVDFELYATDLSISGTSFINSGPAATGGHTAWEFDPTTKKVTQSGDMDIGFAYSGSIITGVEVRIWTKRTNFETLIPDEFEWGIDFDGAAIDSEYGYAQIEIPINSIYDTGNSVATPAPPWNTIVNEVSSSTYPIGAFAEVGINLSNLGIDPSLRTGNACDAPFQKILIKSRSSSSFTSNLKDFAGPYAFLGAPVVPTAIKPTPEYFTCETTEITLTPLTPYAGNHYYDWSTIDGTIEGAVWVDDYQAVDPDADPIVYEGAWVLFYENTDGTFNDSATITSPGIYRLTSAPLEGCLENYSEIIIYAEPCAIDDNMGEVVESGTIIDTVTYNVLDNADGTTDYDLDDANSTLILTEFTAPSNGTITIDATHGEITYTPNPGYFGPDSFEYQICDDTPAYNPFGEVITSGPLCDIALVTVTVLEDVDDDGVGNIYDIDNDNDGIPDAIELECDFVPITNLVQDGNFENTNIITSGLDESANDFAGSVGVWKGSAVLIPNWESADLINNHLEIWQNDNENASEGVLGYGAYSGIQFVEVSASSNDGLYQDVTTTEGDVLTWSFAHRNRSVSTADTVDLIMGDPDGTLTSQGNFVTATDYAWTVHSGFYTVPSGQTTTRIWFKTISGSNFIDKIELNRTGNCYDADGDGVPNYLDLDSDNDGIPDVLEAGLIDGNNDGLVDDGTDFTPEYGINGLADIVEEIVLDIDTGFLVETGILIEPVRNTDAAYDIVAGMYDFLDVDSDNDGLTDTKEAFSNNTLYNDVANDGVIDGFTDTDNNGWHDPIDAEVAFPTFLNSDSDPYPNYLDLDSDGDGIPDTYEANFEVLDGERNGIVGSGIPADSDFDGLADTNDPDFAENVLYGYGFNQDRDGDGVKNYLDIDIDNDGIIDNTEGQGTFAYEKPKNTDQDGDGINDAYDVDRPNGVGIGYTNTDGGSAPDYADLDSDNDAFGILFDIRENFVANNLDADVFDLDNDGMIDPALFVDTDGDGLADVFDLVDGISELDNATNGGQTPYSQPDDDPKSKDGDRDWREYWDIDTDDDNLPDYADLDDDNDGILDIVEQGGDADGDGVPGYLDDDDNDPLIGDVDGLADPDYDLDKDGIPNHLDFDADGDGITDVVESGGISTNGTCNPLPSPLDVDGSGMPGTGILGDFIGTGDVDVNGVPTVVCGGLDVVDTDGDSVPDFLDSDSDNDGIYDVLEAGGIDDDGDGLYGSGAANDTDADGLADALDNIFNFDNIDPSDPQLGDPMSGTPLVIPDTDGDGQVNYLDLDSDNDTIPDNVEGQSTLGYLVPILDDPLTTGINEADTDADGLNNAYDFHEGGTPIVPEDTDGDGIPDYLDLDSDDDGLYDIAEAEVANAAADTDADGMTNNPVGSNGLDDNFDDATAGDTFLDPNGNLNGLPEDYYFDTDGDVLKGGDLDYRDDTIIDFDEDGIPDAIDLDDDNDGILDTVEANNSATDPLFDTDRDGIPDYLDPDFCQLNKFDVCRDLDEDTDGIPNFYDLDSDDDGCTDAIEAYNDISVDEDLDGIYGTGTPTVDTDGLVTAAGVTNSAYDTLPADVNSSSTSDYLEKTVDVACRTDLSLTKDVNNSILNIGDPIIFTLTLTNHGPFETTGVQVRDLMPEDIIDITSSASQGNYDTETGIWNVGTLIYDGITPNIVILTISGTVGPNCGPITNRAEIISSSRLDPDSTVNNNN